MKPYPHVYSVSANGSPVGTVPVASPGPPDLETAPPAEFDGPADTWWPETFLVASVASCFILTFRGVSRAASFGWLSLECRVDGVIERAAGVVQFSRFTTRAKLTVLAGADRAKAHALLERAEKACLVANSLRGERVLEAEVADATR
jgi:organic hydroperoxide reductase OsmC/OhrA